MKKQLPKLIMLIGIPGSGKSSWIKKNSFNAMVVCPDEIRRITSSDISDQTRNKAIFNIVKRVTRFFLKENLNVILDATNVNTFYRQQFIKDLPKCKLLAKLFNVSPDVAYKRVSNDIKNKVNRSNVPKEVIYKMHKEFLETKKTIRLEGFKIIKKL